jgi:flavin reductase (DIM6/NTAB) family NADH-FMN oxidoreductase RutF
MASPFEQLMATLDYPLYVITTAVGDERAGCLMGFATQCSIHPPRFLACISKKNHTYALARRASIFGVHILDKNDAGIAELFGGETGDEVDKFARVTWHSGPSGVPVLDACQRWFAGSVLDHIDLGDHVAFLLEPIEAERDATEEQLTFQRARCIEPGHDP